MNMFIKTILKSLYNLDIEYQNNFCKLLLFERTFRHLVLTNILRVFYYQPLFKLHCDHYGKNLKIFGGMPYFSGNISIDIGDNFRMQGLSNFEARTDVSQWVPELIIGDDVSLGHRNVISVGKKIHIGNRVLTAPEVRIRDNDGHPLDPVKRFNGDNLNESDIKPVKIDDDVWIGAFCIINKGVTIGKAAIIGAGSVVVNDIPAFTIAAGNPARVIRSIE
ncbi:MAG: acyltransferase [Desulfobacteraceae bacterium]|nr:acyltransferase [Desulfobacteraceae bacterium]MBC2749218.1 acyltransferase [Desulfobacteraceae bacterium]